MPYYDFLGFKKQKIEDKEFLNVSVLYNDDSNCNYSVARFYVLANDSTFNKLSSFDKFEDISNYIGTKVRNDGKIGLTLI